MMREGGVEGRKRSWGKRRESVERDIGSRLKVSEQTRGGGEFFARLCKTLRLS